MTAPQLPVSDDAPAFSPLYRQIKALMVRNLQAGEWRPGEAIPSETELAARFRVSQGTVRKAVDELASDNMLVRRQGKGTFVATHAEEKVQFRFLRLMPDQGDVEAMQRRFIDCRRLRARHSGSPGSVCARRTGGVRRHLASRHLVRRPHCRAAG
jgi:GntR family transcriptional regulator